MVCDTRDAAGSIAAVMLLGPARDSLRLPAQVRDLPDGSRPVTQGSVLARRATCSVLGCSQLLACVCVACAARAPARPELRRAPRRSPRTSPQAPPASPRGRVRDAHLERRAARRPASLSAMVDCDEAVTQKRIAREHTRFKGCERPSGCGRGTRMEPSRTGSLPHSGRT